jgi:hypothetical protein
MTDMGLKEARTILGVKAGADIKEIKSRFRELASIHHPDHGGSATEFNRISKAYNTIINWGGKDIVASDIEKKIFDTVFDDWFSKLSSEEQDEIARTIDTLKDEG